MKSAEGIEIDGVKHELVPTKFILLLYILTIFFGLMTFFLTLDFFDILPLYAVIA